MNQPEPDHELEKLLHEGLRALPERPAPPELIPNVLQKIARQNTRAWWRKPWLEWPLGMQILSSLALVAALAGIWQFDTAISSFADRLGGGMIAALDSLRPIVTLAGTLVGALRVLLESVKPQYLLVGAALFVALYGSIIGLGTLGYRFAADQKLNS